MVTKSGGFVPVFVRSANNYDFDAASREVVVECLDESLTLQSQADEADINVLVRRFGLTGTMPVSPRVPQYADYEGVFDYRSALDAVRLAEESFMEIPADIRKKFDNDPQIFLDYCSDPANIDSLREMGLAIPKVKEKSDGGSSEAPAGGDKAGSGS